jgi:putative ABC transport system permease protein
MGIISLTPFDLSLAAVLILLLAILSFKMKLDLSRQIVVAAIRTTVQLFLIGLVLKAIFTYVHILWITLLSLAMLAIAGREVMKRQKKRFAGWWGYGVGASSMCVSSFAITIFSLNVIIGVTPWYEPQYAIPLLGMLLGNTMTGIALGLDRLTQTAWEKKEIIEARLTLGHEWDESIAAIRADSIRSGLIPIINSMTVAGLVHLPGMMTGQILSGISPVEAVKYQILIMFLIAAGTGFGTMLSVWLGSRRLFDERSRLRLDRLK